MAIISVTSDLDVADKFAILVAQSLSGNSAYIRAKETIQEMVDKGDIDQTQKAEIIASIVGSATNNINSTSMSTALAWATAEKDIELKKLELSKQLDILDQDTLIKTAQVREVENSIRLAKIESKRVFGTGVFDIDGNIVSIDTTGKVVKDMELTDEQINKIGVENSLIEQKIKESYAAVHKIIADTYVNYGSYTYSGLTVNGVTGVVQNHDVNFNTLSDTQKDIAIEQAKGYTYNAWANALTGCSSMLGTAIASEVFDFTPGSPGKLLLDTILGTAQNLRLASSDSDDAVPVQ